MAAKRMLRQLVTSDVVLSHEQLHDLVFAATGSKDEAEKAAKRQIHAQLKAGQTPT